MSFTVIPRGPKPKPPIPLHRYMYRACRDIERITRTAPTDSWSQYPLTNIVRAMRNGADELERAIKLRGAEDRGLHQEKLAALRQREEKVRGGDPCLTPHNATPLRSVRHALSPVQRVNSVMPTLRKSRRSISPNDRS
jgi:hypothetical protein